MSLFSSHHISAFCIIGNDPCHNIDIIIDGVENNLPKEFIVSISVQLSIWFYKYLSEVLDVDGRQPCHFTHWKIVNCR